MIGLKFAVVITTAFGLGIMASLTHLPMEVYFVLLGLCGVGVAILLERL
jgi:hypothetical protein